MSASAPPSTPIYFPPTVNRLNISSVDFNSAPSVPTGTTLSTVNPSAGVIISAPPALFASSIMSLKTFIIPVTVRFFVIMSPVFSIPTDLIKFKIALPSPSIE